MNLLNNMGLLDKKREQEKAAIIFAICLPVQYNTKMMRRTAIGFANQKEFQDDI